jgi:hypothetical protein
MRARVEEGRSTNVTWHCPQIPGVVDGAGAPIVICEREELRERVDALTAALRGILDWEGDHAEHLGQCAMDLAKWPCPFERARRLLSESVGED